MSRFRPGVLPSIAVLAALPGLVWLGVWQLSRADEKRELLVTYEARREAAPVNLPTLQGYTDQAYRRVRIEGVFDPEHSLLLDSRTRDGQVGIELLQPFHDLASDRWVLVNRGWQAWPDRRLQPEFGTPTTSISLYAWVYQPAGKPFQLGSDSESGRWPRLVNSVEPGKLWARLGRQGLPYELRLEPGPAALQADWPVVSMSPDKHIGYAVQWFALAATLFGLYLYLGIHNAREHRHESTIGHA
jgi:surfeit locus 1 family protein